MKPKPGASTEAAHGTAQAGRRRRNNYQSYLLRLWRDGESGTWRASSEDTATGQRHFFASFARLAEFLDGQLQLVSQAEPGRPAPRDQGEEEDKDERTEQS